MSFLVTRPEIPVPVRPAISTPCSAAILRTTGEDLVRSRSSRSVAVPPPPRGAVWIPVAAGVRRPPPPEGPLAAGAGVGRDGVDGSVRAGAGALAGRGPSPRAA